MEYSYDSTNYSNISNITLDDIQSDVKNSSISTNLQKCDFEKFATHGILTFYFYASLSNTDKTTLDNIVSNYVYVPQKTDTIAHIKDIKTIGTNGGTFTNGTWQTRTLNTLEGNVSFVSLNNNQFILESGKYIINVRAPACNVRNHQCRLYNITDDTYILGSSAFSFNESITVSELISLIDISSEKTYEVQHICSDTVENVGFGKSTGFSGDEIYTQLTIQLV